MLGITNKWTLIPAVIITLALFAGVAQTIGYLRRLHTHHAVTPIVAPICDCGKICSAHFKCHLRECPAGK